MEPVFLSFLRHYPVPIWLCVPDSLQILMANEAAAAYGAAGARQPITTLADLCPGDDRDRLIAQFRGPHRAGIRSGPWHLQRANGETALVELAAHAGVVGDHPALLVMAWDVTASRRQEEELHRREAELHATLHSVADAVISTDTRGRVVMMNP
ncbi:MAG TPA: hypothetical protein VNN19_10565, partial [bacterium]|nr:hypothetical protein [bacterium]